MVFVLAGERPIAKFASQDSLEESDQSNYFTANDIWRTWLTFPLIGDNIEPYRRLLGHSNHCFGQYDVQSFGGASWEMKYWRREMDVDGLIGLSRHLSLWRIPGASISTSTVVVGATYAK